MLFICKSQGPLVGHALCGNEEMNASQRAKAWETVTVIHEQDTHKLTPTFADRWPTCLLPFHSQQAAF